MRVAWNDSDDRAGLRGYVQFNKYTYIHITYSVHTTVVTVASNKINKKSNQIMLNKWRTINSWVHKIRLHGRRGKGMAESFSR